MGNDLQDLLDGAAASTAKKTVDVVDAVDGVDPMNAVDSALGADDWAGFVDGIEVEAVVGGALQRVRFVRGMNPAQVLTALKSFDPNVTVRDEFPRKSFGNRETKVARVLVVSLRVTDSGKFWDLVAQNGEDLSIAVSKKMADSVLGDIAALNKLGEKQLAKLQEAVESKGSATVILPEDEQFGAKYWKTDDGKAFLDSFQAEPPAEKTEEKTGEDK